MVLGSRPPRKLQRLFVRPSSLRSLAFYQSDAATGVHHWENHILYLQRRAGNVVPLPSGYVILKYCLAFARLSRYISLIRPQLIPAPRGTGLVASPAVKRLLQLAGVQDIYTSSAGSTKTLENTLKATFVAVGNTYGFLTPNLWKETKLNRSPLEEFGDVLREGKRY